MRRILIAVLVLFVAWIALKNVAYSAFIGETEFQPQTPDYYYDEAWLDRPDSPPPGGWDSPWGIDIFVIAPPLSEPAPKGLIAAESPYLTTEYEEFRSSLIGDNQDFEIYAPSYRSPSPASGAARRKAMMTTSVEDVALGLKRYLSADNRDRGLLILTAPGAEPFLEQALEQLPDSDGFRQRFGGIIVSAQSGITDLEAMTAPCSPAFEACVMPASLSAQPTPMRFILPSLPRPEMTYAADAELQSAINSRALALSDWLETNAAKPAEPFDTWAADEIVDVAPIRRPNQDEDISGERGD